MPNISEQILQEKIIEKLETKKLDSSDLKYVKIEIKNILDKEKLIELDKKIEEINFEKTDHFLTYFNGLLKDILGEDTSSLKKDGIKDGIKEHEEVICTNAKEVMSHKLVVRVIKDFYKRKLNGEYNEINNLTEEIIQKEEVKYEQTTGWNKYSREIFFAIENKEDFFIYLFENNVFDKAKQKYLYDERNYVFNIFSVIIKKGFNGLNLIKFLSKYEKYGKDMFTFFFQNFDFNFFKVVAMKDFFEAVAMKEFFKAVAMKDFFEAVAMKEFFKAVAMKEFFKVVAWKEFFEVVAWKEFFEAVDLREFFKVVAMKEFFKAVAMKEFFEVVAWKEFFEVVDLKEFFEVTDLRDFFSKKNIFFRLDTAQDLIIDVNNEKFKYYKKCYIGKKGFYLIKYNSSEKYLIDFNGTIDKIVNIPDNTILVYDRKDGKFKY